MKKYIVRLTEQERQELIALVNKGKSQAYKIKHANILLKADANGENWQDNQIVEAFGCHINTVVNVRQRFVEQGRHRFKIYLIRLTIRKFTEYLTISLKWKIS